MLNSVFFSDFTYQFISEIKSFFLSLHGHKTVTDRKVKTIILIKHKYSFVF